MTGWTNEEIGEMQLREDRIRAKVKARDAETVPAETHGRRVGRSNGMR